MQARYCTSIWDLVVLNTLWCVYIPFNTLHNQAKHPSTTKYDIKDGIISNNDLDIRRFSHHVTSTKYQICDWPILQFRFSLFKNAALIVYWHHVIANYSGLTWIQSILTSASLLQRVQIYLSTCSLIKASHKYCILVSYYSIRCTPKSKLKRD